MIVKDIKPSELNFKETMAFDMFKEGKLVFEDFENDSEFFTYYFCFGNNDYDEICKVVMDMNEKDEILNFVTHSEKRNIRIKFYLPTLDEVKFIIKYYLENGYNLDYAITSKTYFTDNYLGTSSTDEDGKHYAIRTKFITPDFTGRNYFTQCDSNSSMFFAGGSWYGFDIIKLPFLTEKENRQFENKFEYRATKYKKQ